jgi:hypothetical protein
MLAAMGRSMPRAKAKMEISGKTREAVSLVLSNLVAKGKELGLRYFSPSTSSLKSGFH